MMWAVWFNGQRGKFVVRCEGVLFSFPRVPVAVLQFRRFLSRSTSYVFPALFTDLGDFEDNDSGLKL